MARGWESKSVESQIEDRDTLPDRPGGNTHADAPRERALEVLQLSRKRLLEEIGAATNPRFVMLNRRALAHIDSQIAALGTDPASEPRL